MWFAKLFFPAWMKEKNLTFKIVLAALFAAMVVGVNAIPVLKIGNSFKFSALLAVSFFIGVIFGGPIGFLVGFLGDLLGWIIHPDGAYNIFIGISSGLFCFFPGIYYSLFHRVKTGGLFPFVLTAVISYSTCFVLCTMLINSYGIWVMYINHAKYQSFFAYVLSRSAVELINTATNFALTLSLYYPLREVKKIAFFL